MVIVVVFLRTEETFISSVRSKEKQLYETSNYKELFNKWSILNIKYSFYLSLLLR